MTERIRILRIIARLNIGGPAIHATLLTERLDRDRYDSTLACGTETPSEGNYLELHGRTIAKLVTIPELGREIQGAQDLIALGRLVRLCRQLRPDIVHTHTAKAGTLGRMAAFLCRVPVLVHTFHGHVLHGYFSPARTRAFVAVERALARVTDELVAVSPRVRDELLARGVGRPDRFSVVPLGLNLAPLARAGSLRGALRRELGRPPPAPLIGIVARLVPIKAHEVFFRAARLVADIDPDAMFVVVGDGERRSDLEALAAQLGLAARVRFLGWRGDLDRIYADLDVVVLTSRNEGSPVALIEAMAAARPVVATQAGGVVDVVEHGITGLLAPVDDHEGIARAITDLLRSPGTREALGRTAQARVLAAYSAERLIGDIDTLYTRLLSARQSRMGP